MMRTSQRFESSIVCRFQEHTIRVSVSQWWWLIDWSSANYRLIKRIDTDWLIDWVSEWVSLARGCLIAWMRFVLTLTHTHWHWGTHTHTQWCKYQSGDVQIKYQRASMSQRLAVCVASRTKLAHTHTSIWLLLLSHWMVSVSCVCVCCFLSLCEWESMPILDEWLVTQLKWEREREREREIKWWWLNHEWQHYTLSLELWEQEGGGQHYPLEIDVGVCASIQMTERDWCWLYCVIGCVCSCCTSISSSSNERCSSNTTTTNS